MYVAVGRIARSTTGRSRTVGERCAFVDAIEACASDVPDDAASRMGSRRFVPFSVIDTSDSPATSSTCGWKPAARIASDRAWTASASESADCAACTRMPRAREITASMRRVEHRDLERLEQLAQHVDIRAADGGALAR